MFNFAAKVVDNQLKPKLMNFFFNIIRGESADKAHYNHCIVALAEGLKELGYEFYGNIDYWWDHETNEYLIKEAALGFLADVNIYSHHYTVDDYIGLSEVDWKRINVIVDQKDGMHTSALNPRYKDFNLILRPHFLKDFKIYNWAIGGKKYSNLEYLKNVVPWQFGLTNRLIKYVDKFSHIQPQESIFVNHRVSHSLRDLASNNFLPHIIERFKVVRTITDDITVKKEIADPLSYWAQTGRRHDEQYFKTLHQSILNFCFSGWITQKSVGNNPIRYLSRELSSLLAKTNLVDVSAKNYLSIVNYDTWRPWESFLANTIPVMMDYDYWGFELPVMPVNRKHYWGVEGVSFKKSALALNEVPYKELLNIANEGKKWALENYSPKATALRFIELVKNI